MSVLQDPPFSSQFVCTLPFSLSLLVSFRFIWRSTLVSPLVMSMVCHSVSPPRATATELQGDILKELNDSWLNTL